ncbi:hypothetical protein BDZ85DRAFT_256445 [Elsinoe ampelina]|uniref:Uncharacterized protein n=1 Tax=Elsinoe ampelina TaxID=302913 RepID=A0A6A6GLF7_9PEZI|nr:hypothetical protein BDZ85DRAFT_256445 [Elsinoe ampelina]
MQLGRDTNTSRQWLSECRRRETEQEQKLHRLNPKMSAKATSAGHRPIRTTRQPTRHLFCALPLKPPPHLALNQGSISLLILESPRSACTKSGHDMIKGCAAKQNSSRPARQNPLNSIHVLHASEPCLPEATDRPISRRPGRSHAYPLLPHSVERISRRRLERVRHFPA